jgi:hypothetical protein
MQQYGISFEGTKTTFTIEQEQETWTLQEGGYTTFFENQPVTFKTPEQAAEFIGWFLCGLASLDEFSTWQYGLETLENLEVELLPIV